MRVYNIIGQKVATLAQETMMSAGLHKFTFDGGLLATGIYLVRAVISSESGETHVFNNKIVLLK